MLDVFLPVRVKVRIGKNRNSYVGDKGLLFRWPMENNDLSTICLGFKSQVPWLFVTAIIWLHVRVRVRIGEKRNSCMGDKSLLFRQATENNNMLTRHLGSKWQYLWLSVDVFLPVRVRVRIRENRNSCVGDRGLLFRQPTENKSQVLSA